MWGSIADRILVFHEGRIVEEGTHKDLMRLGGLYTKMYQAQAQWYASYALFPGAIHHSTAVLHRQPIGRLQ